MASSARCGALCLNLHIQSIKVPFLVKNFPNIFRHFIVQIYINHSIQKCSIFYLYASETWPLKHFCTMCTSCQNIFKGRGVTELIYSKIGMLAALQSLKGARCNMETKNWADSPSNSPLLLFCVCIVPCPGWAFCRRFRGATVITLGEPVLDPRARCLEVEEARCSEVEAGSRGSCLGALVQAGSNIKCSHKISSPLKTFTSPLPVFLQCPPLLPKTCKLMMRTPRPSSPQINL